jgi:hypothetical protein
VVLELAGSPFHTDAGLHPVRTLLEHHCGIGRTTDPGERLRSLKAAVAARSLDPASVVPLLAPVLGTGAEAGYEPVAAEGRKLYGLIADALGGAGGEPDWPLVAAHYEQAERFDEAAAAYQQASAAALRRGALAEAHSYLTQALGQLDRGTPSRDRDRRELAARLERGFLAAAVEGQQDRKSAADFERCLQLGGTDLRDDQLFATLVALTGYCAGRADVHRLVKVLGPLRAGVEQGQQWFRRTSRGGPQPLGHRVTGGRRHGDAPLQRRTVAATRPHPHRPRRSPSRHRCRPRAGPPPGRDAVRTARRAG